MPRKTADAFYVRGSLLPLCLKSPLFSDIYDFRLNLLSGMIHAWKIALAPALPAAAVALLTVISFIFCFYKRKWLRNRHYVTSSGKQQQLGFASVWRTNFPVRLFRWDEHPALVADAIEHGWVTFGFTNVCSTCSISSSLLDLCTRCCHGIEKEPQISWEMGPESDYMQKIRLNPRLEPKSKKIPAFVQAIQTALPLPGPPLSPRPFPQEGYYEITIFAEGGLDQHPDSSLHSFSENEQMKLISKQFSNTSIEDVLQINVESMGFSQVLAIGLASAAAPPFRVPGCDPGSIGFRSDGRVYLNGALQLEQAPKSPMYRRSWGYLNTIVGCGFDPAIKRIYFTLNGEIIHDLTATSPEFGCPLYPTIASNYDVTVFANFGQSTFLYNAANSHRLPDPCLKQPLSRSAKKGFLKDDSGDLFSMGRIDAQWLGGIDSPTSEDIQHRHALSEAESDLFEIVLDVQS